MTRFGDIGVAERLAHEVHFQVGVNATHGTNQSGDYYCYTYTMPMAGTLTVCLYTTFTHSGYMQEVMGEAGPYCSPAANAGFGFNLTTIGDPNITSVGKDMQFWNPLAAGTVVTIRQRLTARYHPPSVTFGVINGFIRSMRQ